jgi:septum formation protein
MQNLKQANSTKPPILLASSSKYRAQLLRQLGIEFEQASPNIDESALVGESPDALVTRLSEQKARTLSVDYPEHIIIASDQIALTQNGDILGKPKTIDNAIRQLTSVNGEKVVFLTGLCVLSPSKGDVKWLKQSVIEPYTVYFRQLSEQQIINYVRRELPLDCAGSFKSEGLGISLFEKFEGQDPHALIGLPLIKLCSFLSIAEAPVL